MFAHASRASWRRDSRPGLYAARAKWSALEPSISVLSRSKKAAPSGPDAAQQASTSPH